jgi:hypothetical protein
MNNVQSMDLKSAKQHLVDQIKDFGTSVNGSLPTLLVSSSFGGSVSLLHD